MKPLQYVILALLVSTPAFAQIKPKTAFVGISQETALPFLELTNNTGTNKPEIKSGLLKEFADALFAEMKIPTVLVLLPQKRVAPDLISGELSIVCYAHESWYPALNKEILWSKEIATNTNYIVSLGKNRAKKIEDLFGKRVGAIVNYVYQNLEPYFEKKKIQRENAPNNDSNLQLLLHGRIDYMVLSNLEYEYYKKSYPKLEADDLNMDTLKVKCALSKKSGIQLEDLNQAIEKLRVNGKLSKIFKS